MLNQAEKGCGFCHFGRATVQDLQSSPPGEFGVSPLRRSVVSRSDKASSRRQCRLTPKWAQYCTYHAQLCTTNMRSIASITSPVILPSSSFRTKKAFVLSPHPLQDCHQLFVAAGRGLPVYLNHRRALSHQALGERPQLPLSQPILPPAEV